MSQMSAHRRRPSPTLTGEIALGEATSEHSGRNLEGVIGAALVLLMIPVFEYVVVMRTPGVVPAITGFDGLVVEGSNRRG